jgi:hypothetical protein
MGHQVTPYQVALCILIDAYVKPNPELNLPLGQDLCLFLVREAISSTSFKEPTLPLFLRRLQAAVPPDDALPLQDFLISRLALANCPDALFQFFVKIRGEHSTGWAAWGMPGTKALICITEEVPSPVLELLCLCSVPSSCDGSLSLVPISPLPPELLSTSGAPGEVLDEEAILLQPGSALGIFVRRVLLAFNSLSFEVRPGHSEGWHSVSVPHENHALGSYPLQSSVGFPMEPPL